MPKLPGRESTRKTLELEDIEVASFVGVWDKYVYKKTCCVTGCDHIISGVWKEGHWETCGEGAGSAIVYDKNQPDDVRQHHYAICVCCLGKLDEAWRAMNGYPD